MLNNNDNYQLNDADLDKVVGGLEGRAYDEYSSSVANAFNKITTEAELYNAIFFYLNQFGSKLNNGEITYEQYTSLSNKVQNLGENVKKRLAK